MPEKRRGPSAELARIIDEGILAARSTMGDPWPALERAHIASQPWALPHTRVHVAMLRVAWRQRDRRELTGQLIRTAVAGIGSLARRYPPGNTGRTTMGLNQHGPMPADLEDLLVRRA